MSYVFFPGCSLDGTARDFHRSTLAVAAKLGLELPELKDWICCGSTAAHATDPLLADALPAMSLWNACRGGQAKACPTTENALAGKSLLNAGGVTVAVACAACYSRLKMANHRIAGDPAVRARVARVVGGDYDGLTPVRHLLEILCREIGLARIAQSIRCPLAGLKVACYYGCLLTRPPEITNFDDAENPTLMDRLMETAGATPLEWPHKTECCGASFSITNASIVLELSNEILAMAKAAGADCIATACPLCQLNLDLRQKDIEARFGRRYQLPVFYFTQLLGLAMGCPAEELSLGSLVVEPQELLAAKGIGC